MSLQVPGGAAALSLRDRLYAPQQLDRQFQAQQFQALAARLDNDSNLDYLNLARPSVRAGLSSYIDRLQAPLHERPELRAALAASPLGDRLLLAFAKAEAGQLDSEDITYLQAFLQASGIAIEHAHDSDGIDGVYGLQTHLGLQQLMQQLLTDPEPLLQQLMQRQSQAESHAKDALWNLSQGSAEGNHGFLEGVPDYPGQPVLVADGAGQRPGKSAQSISYSSAQAQQRGQRAAQKAQQIARGMGGSRSTGKCYNAVKRALSDHIKLTGVPAHSAAGQLARSPLYRELTGLSPAQLRNLPAGAVVVWGKSKKSPYGHISVALGNGREASDYVGPQMTSLRGFTNFRVFLPK